MRDELAETDDLVGLAVPRYCPRCDGDVEATETLCPACGEVSREQGYCPVCECSWRLSLGADCPKHEIPLEDRPRRAPASFAEARAERWITVAEYADASRADAPRLRLEAEGIPTFLDGERMARNVIYQFATGGVKLQVPADQVGDARILLAQTWTPLAEADDLDDAWEELAPAPWEARRKIMKGVIVLILLGPLLLGLVTTLASFLSLGR
jgi:hypothetical protein